MQGSKTATMANRNTTMADLYSAFAPGAARLAYLLTGNKELAEDLVQDAFLRMFGRFENLRKPESFQAYLHRTIVNLSRKHWRRRELEKTISGREHHLNRNR